jgi:hypothetical protein
MFQKLAFASTILATVFGAASAQAAQITNPHPQEILIDGTIESGDAKQFEQVLASVTQKWAVVILTGPGGSVAEGLSIGEKIRAHGFDTFVHNKCSSVCALIWLAGSKHYVDESSVIGFHAAYTNDGTQVHESGSANAIVGAYLTNLGYSYAAIIYATSAPPDKISWMTAVDTLRLNIDVKFLSKGLGAAPATAPALMARTPSPEQAANLAKGIELNARLNVSESLLRQKVGAGTVAALVDWLRSAAAKDPSLYQRLYAQPDPYGWAYTLMVESQRPPSVAPVPPPSYTPPLPVVPAAVGSQLYETGLPGIKIRVPMNRAEPPNVPPKPPAAPSYTPASPVVPGPLSSNGAVERDPSSPSFFLGHEDRVKWERWITSLAGEYQIGALFWAEVRNNPRHQSCSAASTGSQFLAGCLKAQQSLTIIDRSRNSDAQYWFGWNTYELATR